MLQSKRHAAACLAGLSLLAACGGGGDAEPAPPAQAVRAQAQTLAFFPDVPIPAGAATAGLWSPVYAWPLFPAHAALLPDGRVASYGVEATNYGLWDGAGSPAAGHTVLPNGGGTNLFCSSLQLLPDSGDLFIAGGDTLPVTNLGNPNSNVIGSGGIRRGDDMNRVRWYSTSITTIDGETYVHGGLGGQDRPEIRAADGRFRVLDGADTSRLSADFARIFVAPDGRVFGITTAMQLFYVDPRGAGQVTQTGNLAAFNTGGLGSSAAMFRPGKILQLGGSSNAAVVIDLNQGALPVASATNSLSSRREFVNATLLPDGRVLATGGNRDRDWFTPNAIAPDNVNTVAEIWDPRTGQWTEGATAAVPRLYHSGALLLPDASVLVFGGEAPRQPNVEIYYPPYFFSADGRRAPRPALVDAPTTLEIGKTFELQVAASTPIGRVTLVRTGAVTHSFDMGQRFLDLTYVADGARLRVQAPTRAGEAPPGYYHLFVLDADGVPSVSQIVRIGVAPDPNPATRPTLAAPGTQTTIANIPARLQLAAADPNGDRLAYNATGLPPGLAIDAASGLISGTPNLPGDYDATVTVSDGISAASANLRWTVQPPVPLAFVALPLPAPVASGGPAAYRVDASGVNLRYRWDFGDGSGETAWSASPAIEHRYAAPGVYGVTVTITDDSGAHEVRSLTQVVYRPAVGGRPTASSNIVLDGAARLWLVNPDGDSISLFDSASRARLAEIAVGAAPRTLAAAADGALWVANKGDATISIVDPATRSVRRTLALPRGSQPFGIAMSPRGDSAYVSLEATGQVLKFDTASLAQTGAAEVGPNPRHLALSPDGASLYVSRYVTPPLPGESTAAVSVPAGRGAEVLQLAAASLAPLRTITLGHSDAPDLEASGRGVPNYLGALAIAPDGTQAWVPGKQDNLRRGALRDGLPLNFQNTVRAVSSRIDLASGREDLARRIDHDNASVASAAIYDPRGVFLFVALETSREVAVVDATSGRQLARVEVGRAPQGLALSGDGRTLYVHNYMDRSVSVLDVGEVVEHGLAVVTPLATLAATAGERLGQQVLQGKRLFYDARDPRLARERYLSCATCHNDGGHDGRVWDFTGFGEGLRNTPALRGRAATGQGYLHWSANFDEVQDFEGQIRALAGGTGLLSDALFNAGTRAQPLGDAKAGLSADLDALAAYVASLAAFEPSPYRPSATALSAPAQHGRALYAQKNCASCHSGDAYTNSGSHIITDAGTLSAASGQRLGQTLWGIDVPTLRDAWLTAPYLHNGSAPTLQAAIGAHTIVSTSSAERDALAAYLRELGADEGRAPERPGSGAGLNASYYANKTLSGPPAASARGAIDYAWGSGAPAAGVPADNYSARYAGRIEAPAGGTYGFRLESDGGTRLTVRGRRLVANWTSSGAATSQAEIYLDPGTRVAIGIDYLHHTGNATLKLSWKPPGYDRYVTVPLERLYPN